MSKKFKIINPKPCMNDEGTLELQEVDKIIEASSENMQANMEKFVANGWAMEVKMDSVEETLEVEAEVEIKRARNDKGHLIGDDDSTPDVNEAWEGGEAPVKKKTTKKKTTSKKKTTKKAT